MEPKALIYEGRQLRYQEGPTGLQLNRDDVAHILEALPEYFVREYIDLADAARAALDHDHRFYLWLRMRFGRRGLEFESPPARRN